MNVRKSLSLPAEIVAALERHRAALSDRLEADVTLSAAVVNLVRTYLRVPKTGKNDKGGRSP